MYRRWLLNARMILSLTALSCFANAQTNSFTFNHLDQANGLASTNVSAIAQDSSGFLWLATSNGLQRYDGLHFITYRHDPGDSLSLSSDLISDVFVDHFNNVWAVTTPFSVFVLDRYRQKFVSVLSGKEKKDIQLLSLSPSGEVWAIGRSSIYKYDYEKKKFSLIASLNSDDSSITFSRFVFDQNGKSAWIAGDSGIYSFDVSSGKIISCDKKSDAHYIAIGGGIHSLYADHEGNLWVSTYAPGLFCYEKSDNRLLTFDESAIRKEFHLESVPHIFFSNFLEDRYGHIWIATYYGGLLQYDRTSNQFHSFQYSASNPKSLRYDVSLFGIMEDRDGNLWVGSDEGVNYFNPGPALFTNYFYQENVNNSFPNGAAQSFVKTRSGEIWIATYGGGVVRCDSQFNIIHIYKSAGSNNPVAAYDQFFSLTEDGDGKIWIGGREGTLSIYDPLTDRFQNLQPKELHGSTPVVMQNDAEGNIWFGMRQGYLSEWNAKEKKFFDYDSLFGRAEVLHSFIYDLYPDKDGAIWIANGEHGLMKLNAAHDAIQKFTAIDPSLHDVSADSNVLCLNRYDDSTLVVGTLNNGIYLFNKHSEKFHRLKPANGKFNAFITGVSSPIDNKLWVASPNGLSLYDLQKSELINYSEADGIVNDSYSSVFYPYDHKLLVGNGTGFLSINPSAFSTSIPKLNVEITGFTVFDLPISIDSLIEKKLPVHLSYKQNYFSISFICPSYFQTQSFFYSFRLRDVDPDWRTATNNPEATYTGLKGGTYVFEVRSENSAHEQGPVTQLTIVVQPPFWQTTWFYFLVAAVMLLLLAVIYYSRIRKIRREERMRAEVNNRIQEMKLTVLRTQLNPHFMFNSLNAIHNFILNNDQHQATVYLSKFARLMRMVLDTSQQNLIPLQQEMEMLSLYLELEKLRLNNSLDYSIHADEKLNTMETMVQPLLMQPCIENAIWHGLNYKEENRKLELQIHREDSRLCFELEDNGVGREAAAKLRNDRNHTHESKGISIVQERLDLLGKQFKISSSMD
ncbi:MAG: two-component regulator propeller domain-containing protein, partial [Chitinophagales bacterium]